MGKSVVFTGAAFDAQGHAVLRADLAAAAEQAGFTVLKAVKPGVTFLVASRKDTVKARNALDLGVATLTYPEFIGSLAAVGIAIVKSGAAPDKYVDHGPLDQVPDFTTDFVYGGVL